MPSRTMPLGTPSAADVELWSAALEQIQREQGKDLALVNETLPSADFLGYLSRNKLEVMTSDCLDSHLSRCSA